MNLKYFLMKVIIINIALTYLLNGEFVESVLLENLQKIKKINISYKDTDGNRRVKSIKISRVILNDSIIFSELHQNIFIDGIFLKNPKKIDSIFIEYIDKDNNNISKTVNIKNNSIKNNNLYIYENNDYLHRNIRKNNNLLANKKFIKKDVIKRKEKKRITHKKIFNSKNSLDVSYFDNGDYVDILLKNCNEGNDFCNNGKFMKLSKRVIFYLPFKLRNTKKINLSKNIKRVQVAYDSTRQSPTWLVVGSFKVVSKIKKMYHKDNKYTFSKPSFKNLKKVHLAYRIHFE